MTRCHAFQPFEGADRTGMPEGARALLTAEVSAVRRLSPVHRNRWSEVFEFDDRVTDLERRQAEVSEQIGELRDELAKRPTEDEAALAAWHLAGAKGARPEARTGELERRMAEAQADYDSLTAAVSKVFDDKVGFVAKHRGRLIKDADRRLKEAHAPAQRQDTQQEQAPRASLRERPPCGPRLREVCPTNPRSRPYRITRSGGILRTNVCSVTVAQMPSCSFLFNAAPDDLLERLKPKLVSQGDPVLYVWPADQGAIEFSGPGSEFVVRSRACQALADVWPGWQDELVG